jgi:hypothetical protein
LRSFDDSDSRAQYGFWVISGAYSTSLWRMTVIRHPIPGETRTSDGRPA